jgi:hypothetical protein
MNGTLTFKEEAMLAISRLPSKATARKIQETIDILAALRNSEKASAEGRVVPHENVVRRFRSWRRK